jgi:hypothetical protein
VQDFVGLLVRRDRIVGRGEASGGGDEEKKGKRSYP